MATVARRQATMATAHGGSGREAATRGDGMGGDGARGRAGWRDSGATARGARRARPAAMARLGAARGRGCYT
ncbi:hypothetical protein [Oryza sativa Japonica Group]|uniref:Uncharacterized protein n=1 Tax=Oryza sativa subsp. japonica TaxID=39947 RepID=Q5JN43_ORYSJ|nr:hypothetical protein [Oryza sativa Japonica Group]